jgi:hypothetical protein
MKNLENELKANCEQHREKLMNLKKEYELAKLGLEMYEQQEKEIDNKVLAENVFTAEMDVPDMNIKKGDRITCEEETFLMSDADFQRYQELTTKGTAAAGLTTEDGYYITNWHIISVKAKQALINFLLDYIVPAPMRGQMEGCRTRVVYQDKLLAAFDKCIK